MLPTPFNGALTGLRLYTARKKGSMKALSIFWKTGMKNYERLIKEISGMDMSQIPGSGAAGGLGAALVAFFGAVLKTCELILFLTM